MSFIFRNMFKHRIVTLFSVHNIWRLGHTSERLQRENDRVGKDDRQHEKMQRKASYGAMIWQQQMPTRKLRS